MDDTDWQLMDFGPKPKKAKPKPNSVKGECPKCGKHIGRGVHFHTKACEGLTDVNL